MKKFWLLTTLLFGAILLIGCTNNSQPNLETEEGRLVACNDRVGFYLNTNMFTATWSNEQEWWASFILNWHVVREENWETAEDDVQCVIDMVDKSVNVEFTNHKFNGELQKEDTCTWSTCEIPNTSEEDNTYTIVGPGNWFDEELESWKLVLRKWFEDHTDIIFIEQSLRQDYIDSSKMVYWDEVVFKWETSSIDWAAGTHYYNADSIEQLEELFSSETN